MSNPFGPESIAKAVHTTLAEATAALPEGENHAVFIDATYSKADGPEAKIVYVQRAPHGWVVDFEGAYAGPKGASGRVALMRAWK